MKTTQKGFTLLELLIVIAILAVLATIAVLVINPVEYLRQARDSQRIADLDTLRGAINLYLSTATSPSLTTAACRTYNATTSPFLAGGACTVAASAVNTGGGWVNIDFTTVPSGAPIAKLPIDPLNTAANQYFYGALNAGSLFELNTSLESAKFSGMEANTIDGGNNGAYYEIGTSLTL